MRAETGEMPVLLLDDVLSELDPPRRRYVLDRIAPARGQAGAAESRQVWITTTETESFPADFLAAAQRFNIDAGAARPA
jgi:recombinational DNA repair ATPase RecF